MTLSPLFDKALKTKSYTGSLLNIHQLMISSLWILTTEEPIPSIAERFNISKVELYRGFRFVCETIARNKHIFVKWPTEATIMKNMETFNNQSIPSDSNNDTPVSFPGVCGIIGSTNIRIPLTEDCVEADSGDDKSSIIKLQVVCDFNGKFMDCHVEQFETSSNVMVFNRSALKRMLDRNPYALPEEGHLIGDQTYPLKTFIMVPFKEHRKSYEMNRFNDSLMFKRKIIDRTFNQMKERFSRLRFVNMQISTELSQCIETASVIHNFCIENSDAYCLQLDDTMPMSRAICRDFTIDQRALDKRSRILDNFKFKEIK